MLSREELQTLRNMGNECEAAADEMARLTAALEQAEMDMAAIWVALPKKDADKFMVARDRVRKALEVGGG